MHPGYSVIIPVCHGGTFLHKALATLDKVRRPAEDFEVLVVGNSGELDAAESMFGNQQRLRFIRHRGNRSSALNAACAASKGDIWIFTDDDCVFPTDWLLRIEESLARHPHATVIGGSDRLPDGSDLFDLALDHALNSVAATGGIRKNVNLGAGHYYPKLWNMIVKSQNAQLVALPEGIFDTDLDVHEDVELVDRIRKNGGRVRYEPRIVVGHYRDTDFRSFVLRNAHMARVCRKKNIHSRAHLVLSAFLVTLLATGATAAFMRPSALAFGLLSGSYAGVLAATGLGAALRSGRPVLTFMVPGLILALHAARATGFLAEAARRT